MGERSPIYLYMNGYSCGLDVSITIDLSNEDKLISLLKEFGSRNFQWHNLGFQYLTTLPEIMFFLKYKIENQEIIIHEYFGEKIGNDAKFWKFCAPVIESGHFTLYGENQTKLQKHLEFSKGKLINDSK